MARRAVHTGQAGLAMFAVLAPMVWPQILPRATFTTFLIPPGPPPPPSAAGPAVRPRRSPATAAQIIHGVVFEPATMPPVARIIEDLPAAAGGNGVPGAVGDAENGVRGGVLDSIMRGGAPPIAPAPAAAPAHTAPPAENAPAPKRIRISALRVARLVHRVEPDYPALARKMRVSGVVQLEGIIGTDGRLRKLRVLSGHPMLARAALDAVSQWIYEPTLLGGDPVEVIAPIIVTFRLN